MDSENALYRQFSAGMSDKNRITKSKCEVL